MPLWARSFDGLQLEGREQRSRTDNLRTVVNVVDLHYFETAGVAIENGRDFSDLDREISLPVAIVNKKMARDYWPGGAIGKRLQLPGEKEMRRVVGVASIANYSTWGEPAQLCVYIPLSQHYSDGLTMYVRSKGNPLDVMVPVEREIRSVGPEILISNAITGPEVVNGGLFQARVGVTMLGVFGFLALGLASVGLYGILAYSVNQRMREIGLRMALGAAQSSVLRLILRQGMSLVFIGVAIGFAASVMVGRVLSRLLYGVSAADPISVGGAAVVLLAVALLACYLPARWASRVDPLVALREG
jgi:putative ABC transport system permease protein